MTKRTFTLKDALIFTVIILLVAFTLSSEKKRAFDEGYRKGGFEVMTACKLGVINCRPGKKDLRT